MHLVLITTGATSKTGTIINVMVMVDGFMVTMIDGATIFKYCFNESTRRLEFVSWRQY